PVEQYVPTFADSKSIATSGAFPARIEATIFAVGIAPATEISTSGCLASYSAIVLFTMPSSRASNGSHTLSRTGLAAVAEPSNAAAAATASRSPATRRLIAPSREEKLVNFPAETLRRRSAIRQEPRVHALIWLGSLP